MKKLNKNKIVTAVMFSTLLTLSGTISAFAAGPAAVNLLSAGNFVVLTKSGISTTGSTIVIGDIGVSPAAASLITGFGLTLPSQSAFATSPLVSGKIYAPDYAVPTPTYTTTAVSDMETAYTDASGRSNPSATELGAGNISGLTIAPGLYKWGTGVTIQSDVTLSGAANDVWIFQIAQTLTLASNVKINLIGGAQASNIFWVVAGQTTIGTGATFNGNILDQTAIVLNTGAKLNGRALAQTAVTLDASSVVSPSQSVAVFTPTPTQVVVPVSQTTITPQVNTNTGNTNTGNTASYPVVTQNNPSQNTSSSATASSFGQSVRAIATNLHQGSRGNDVNTLQQFLISQNKGSAARALANVGATSYFGVLTRAALAEFQANVGISPALGNFGSVTRGFVNTH